MTRLAIAQRSNADLDGNLNQKLAEIFQVQTSRITRLWYTRYEKTNSARNPENLDILAWVNLPDTLIRNVVESMPQRIQQCIRKGGGHTGF